MTDVVYYIAVDDVDTYFGNRGAIPTEWSSATPANQEKALLTAAEWMDRTYGARWKGSRSSTSQVRDWPRTGVTDRDGNSLSSTTTPTAVRYANAEAALLHLRGELDSLPGRVDGRAVKSQTISASGVSKSVEYLGGGSVAASQNATFPKLDAMLAELLDGEGAGDAAMAFGIGGGGGPVWPWGGRY